MKYKHKIEALQLRIRTLELYPPAGMSHAEINNELIKLRKELLDVVNRLESGK